jgi:hypothetical protein
MTTKRGRGRPPFQPTPTQRRRVEEMVAVGMSRDEIGRALGCSVPTLEKYFEDELLNGHSRRKAELNDILFKAARKGNITAAKALRERVEVAATGRENFTPAPAPAAEPAPPKEKPIGKKEEQALAARTPDTKTPLGELMARRMGNGLPN